MDIFLDNSSHEPLVNTKLYVYVTSHEQAWYDDLARLVDRSWKPERIENTRRLTFARYSQETIRELLQTKPCL
jgi:hypothetical protein